MDDWVVFAKTRWYLKKAIKITNQILEKLRVEKHPDKIGIGRVATGFDFCGFRFSHEGVVSLASATLQKITVTAHKLYECSSCQVTAKVRLYLQHVMSWVVGVVQLCGAGLLKIVRRLQTFVELVPLENLPRCGLSSGTEASPLDICDVA